MRYDVLTPDHRATSGRSGRRPLERVPGPSRILVIGIMRLAAGRTAAAVVAFAGAIFVAAVITWLLWLNRRASSRGVGG